MQSFTITEWAIVALVFVAGWLLGLASHPGGRKWRERYAAERDAHAAYRRDADARVTAAETRHRELERDHDRVVAATPVAATPVAPVATRPIASRVVRPGDTGYEKRGWFDFAPRR
ncbi:hypothetical protein [Sphingomonas sp.]|jgi:hypothetical protein|uniref:hypothetical protein n=1 Tax=Sphingomonas sp. TaxID=28214 RepID=UPI002D7F8186|nr:hypothetical protein [Sphingomonas sp.]HEU0044052.1 hypothetical protein [Sphingomonas sp.]